MTICEAAYTTSVEAEFRRQELLQAKDAMMRNYSRPVCEASKEANASVDPLMSRRRAMTWVLRMPRRRMASTARRAVGGPGATRHPPPPRSAAASLARMPGGAKL